MKNDKRQTAGTIMALVGGTCWGFSGCCGQYLFEQKGIEAPWLAAGRVFFAGRSSVLAGFKLHGRENLRVFQKRRDTVHLLAFAIFGITFCQFTYFMAIQASNAGTATVLQYLSPILILAVVCMRELSHCPCWAPLSSAPTGIYTPFTSQGKPCSGACWQLSAP